jgi:hypothetical protein
MQQETLEMPNDAKLGLILGVGVVIAISVVFFRKEPGTVGAAAAAVSTPKTAPAASSPGSNGSVK